MDSPDQGVRRIPIVHSEEGIEETTSPDALQVIGDWILEVTRE